MSAGPYGVTAAQAATGIMEVDQGAVRVSVLREGCKFADPELGVKRGLSLPRYEMNEWSRHRIVWVKTSRWRVCLQPSPAEG